MTRLFDYITAQDDPYEFIYEAINGTHGEAAWQTLSELYDDIVVDCGLHPDDDYERIVEIMVERMEN